jgi:hypothetical protein
MDAKRFSEIRTRDDLHVRTNIFGENYDTLEVATEDRHMLVEEILWLQSESEAYRLAMEDLRSMPAPAISPIPVSQPPDKRPASHNSPLTDAIERHHAQEAALNEGLPSTAEEAISRLREIIARAETDR